MQGSDSRTPPDYTPALADARRIPPAADRNKTPISDALLPLLPPAGHMLEIASGAGLHMAHLCEQLPGWTWQPTDIDETHFPSIAAWTAHAGLQARVGPPTKLDVCEDPWAMPLWQGAPLRPTAILCINMIHIAPLAALEGLIVGAGRCLPAGCPLILYGPFSENGRISAPSNAAFDRQLRGQNPNWGIRDVQQICDLGGASGFEPPQRKPMPANNELVVLRKRAAE